MKNEFVPYDIALAMKELGFDEECTAVYFGEYEERDFDNGIALEYRQSQYYAQKGWSKGLLAPLYQQAFRWFREKYGIWVTFEYDDCDCVEADICWYVGKCFRYGIGPLFLTNELGDFKTYKEAQDACLRKLIEIVKEKQHGNN